MMTQHTTPTANNALKRLLRVLSSSFFLFVSVISACAENAITPVAENKGPTERHRLVFFTGATQIFDSDIDAVFGVELHPGWRWHGFELGSELEFRSGIELSREFQRGY